MSVNFSLISNTDTQTYPETSLSERFKSDSSGIHKKVERHDFVVRLMKKELSTQEYFQHLTDLHHVYSALEKEIKENQNVESLSKIYFPMLERTIFLEKDLNTDHFKEMVQNPSDQAVVYANHLHTLGTDNPYLLIAHSYTRYLGDLSGGMILKKRIVDVWPAAINFYDFQEITTPIPQFKEHYKNQLDGLLLTDSDKDLLVQEVTTAFEFSGTLFDAALNNF